MHQSAAQHYADLVNRVYGSAITLNWEFDTVIANAGEDLEKYDLDTLFFKDGSTCKFAFTEKGVVLTILNPENYPTHSIDETVIHEDYDNPIFSLNVLENGMIMPMKNLGGFSSLAEALKVAREKGIKIVKVAVDEFYGIIYLSQKQGVWKP